jgi:hypothetical protein
MASHRKLKEQFHSAERLHIVAAAQQAKQLHD